MFRRTDSINDDTKGAAAEMEIKREPKKSEKMSENPERNSQLSSMYLSNKKKKIPAVIQSRIKEDSNLPGMAYNLGVMMSSKMRRMQGGTFVCGICECDYEIKEKTKLADCDHGFCNSCLQHYALYKVERFEDILCPEEDCDKPMNMKGEFFCGLPN